ncbi:MAG: hypothetical protein FWD74_00865 [Actinomycetia bacterium]|nr:hypothetical protein [Actinomycetes bacterium]
MAVVPGDGEPGTTDAWSESDDGWTTPTLVAANTEATGLDGLDLPDDGAQPFSGPVLSSSDERARLDGWGEPAMPDAEPSGDEAPEDVRADSDWSVPVRVQSGGAVVVREDDEHPVVEADLGATLLADVEAPSSDWAVPTLVDTAWSEPTTVDADHGATSWADADEPVSDETEESGFDVARSVAPPGRRGRGWSDDERDPAGGDATRSGPARVETTRVLPGVQGARPARVGADQPAHARPVPGRPADGRRAANRAPTEAARYSGARQRGIAGWLAVIVLIAISAAGAAFDYARDSSASGLGSMFNVALVVGSVLAICVVVRRGMFSVLVAPPLVYFVISMVMVYERSNGLKDRAKVIAAAQSWLVNGFPAIAIATMAVVAITVTRMIVSRVAVARLRRS